MNSLRYTFIIERDYGQNKYFTTPVKTVEDAVLTENMLILIANWLEIPGFVGSLEMMDGGEWVEYYGEEYESYEEESTKLFHLQGKRCPEMKKNKRTIEAFIAYLNDGKRNLNPKFFVNMVERQLKPVELTDQEENDVIL